MSDPLVLRFQVPGNDFSRAGAASSNVKKTLKQLGFPADIVRKVAVALYEAEINSVIHADGGEVTAEIHADRVILQVSDNGPGIPDIDLAMQSGYSTATEFVRNMGFGAGMGLPNIREYTDFLEIESVVGKGTTVKMTIKNC